MPTRSFFVAVDDLDLIRDAVASQKADLVEAVMQRQIEEDDEEDPDFREWAESMIMCGVPPQAEPGCWNYAMLHLAEHFDLNVNDELEINDDIKHYATWEAYRSEVGGKVSDAADRSLQFIRDGRPLKGDRIDHDGCMFGWLTTDEARQLHTELSKLSEDDFDDDELFEFVHEPLVNDLQTVADAGQMLLITAS